VKDKLRLNYFIDCVNELGGSLIHVNGKYVLTFKNSKRVFTNLNDVEQEIESEIEIMKLTELIYSNVASED